MSAPKRSIVCATLPSQLSNEITGDAGIYGLDVLCSLGYINAHGL